MATGTQDRASQQTNMAPTGYSELQTKSVGLDPSQIRSVILADGYHNVSQCSLVQFAIGIAHSPIEPVTTYPALQFMDSETGNWYVTPLRQIQGYSTESISSDSGLRLSNTRSQ